MENKPVSQRVAPFLVLYDIHTGLFPNVLINITEKDAHNRLNTKANHVAWLAGSLVQQRAELAGLFGVTVKQEADELFKNFKGIQEGVTYPSLASYQKDWDKITPIAKDALLKATDEKLDIMIDMDGMKFSHYDMTAFHVHREAYVIGQIALWRRLMGYDAMKYPGM